MGTTKRTQHALAVRDESSLMHGDHPEGEVWWDPATGKLFTGLVVEHDGDGALVRVSSVRDGWEWGPQVFLGDGLPVSVAFVVRNWLMGLSLNWNQYQRRANFLFKWGSKTILEQVWTWSANGEIHAVESDVESGFLDEELKRYR